MNASDLSAAGDLSRLIITPLTAAGAARCLDALNAEPDSALLASQLDALADLINATEWPDSERCLAVIVAVRAGVAAHKIRMRFIKRIDPDQLATIAREHADRDWYGCIDEHGAPNEYQEIEDVPDAPEGTDTALWEQLYRRAYRERTQELVSDYNELPEECR